MKYRHKISKELTRYFCGLFFVIALLFLIATSNDRSTIVASNVNTVKAIESSRVVLPIKDEYIENEKSQFFSIEEIIANQGNLAEFNGTLNGYSYDCDECSNNLVCLPSTNVSEDNIYYNDMTYGQIRILAADSNIPCGSIIKVSNYDNQVFYGIVLDRKNNVQGLIIDLLFNNKKSIVNFEKSNNVNFKIERWGF